MVSQSRALVSPCWTVLLVRRSAAVRSCPNVVKGGAPEFGWTFAGPTPVLEPFGTPLAGVVNYRRKRVRLRAHEWLGYEEKGGPNVVDASVAHRCRRA